MINFDLTDEQRLLEQSVREWAARDIAPHIHESSGVTNKSNTIIAVLGHNADPKTAGNYNVRQSQWKEGIFNASHGSCWDKDGNLYVQDWNVDGRIMKLVRVK